jgi:deoxyribodipyrimidine photo-lyase
MKKTYKKAIFIFRRDLRVFDNTALNKALELAEAVIPCFIFDPQQVGAKNPYKSNNCIQFMIESLQDLANQLAKKDGKLYTFYGETVKTVTELLKISGAEAVLVNQDYTPFSRKRDEQIQTICEQKNVVFESCFDALLVDPTTFSNKQNKPYTIFTPFFKSAIQIPIPQPTTKQISSFFTKKIDLSTQAQTIDITKELTPQAKILSSKNPALAVHGGRTASAKILNNLGDFKNYDTTHNIPSIPTTLLSAYNKYGTHSIREVLYAMVKKLGPSHDLMRQLYWRDFYYHILWHFPHVMGQAFKPQYNSLTWSSSQTNFEKWCQGQTGFPLVDAGMRQLNTTGFMHNRVRMIVASFLVKDLHINWQDGEKYFAQQLVDYDPAVNNGNWQWSASTGCDAQPYFRIFNPWLQQKKFDHDCTYIKQWVPELKNYTAKEIHNHFKAYLTDYYKPMIDHADEKKRTLAKYKQAR